MTPISRGSAPPNQTPPAKLSEIAALIEHLPAVNEAARDAAAARQNRLTKPRGALGRLEDLAIWLAGWQETDRPRVDHPSTCVFAGNHGVVAQGVSAYPAAVTVEMVKNFTSGGAAVNQLCGLMDSELRVFELALDQPTADFTQGPAMGEEDCVHALVYGMTSVAQGIDLLAVGEMGIGNTTSAAAICHALYGGTAADWVGRGTGVDDATLERKIAVVSQGVARHAALKDKPLEILAALGGHELAAIAGAILAARMARVAVLLDGYVATAAAAVLHALDPKALDHCQVAHVSAEPGHARLLAKLNKKPLLDLGMRLGEGSGAVLAMALVKAAVACHNGMATFDEAGVSEKLAEVSEKLK